MVVKVKCFLSYLFKRKIINDDLSTEIKTPRRVEKEQEVLSEADINKIEKYLNGRIEKFKFENLRDKIVLYLGIKCGFRKSEIMDLNWENIDFENSELKILNSKGGKNRVVCFNGYLKKMLLKYRRLKGKYIGAVVRGKNSKRICSNTMQKITKRIYEESGVYRKGLTIHSLRHYGECYIMVSEVIKGILTPHNIISRQKT